MTLQPRHITALAIVGACPGLTGHRIAEKAGRGWDSVRNDLYALAQDDLLTHVYFAGHTAWFLTERGRGWVRRNGGLVTNDEERTIAPACR